MEGIIEMFNEKFLKNWLNILKYNGKLRYLESPETMKEVVNIPFTPFEINAFLFHSLVKTLYPKFITDKNNILDVIVSEDNSKILAFYFYETDEAGIVEKYDEMEFKSMVLNLEKHDSKTKLASSIYDYCLEEKGLNIGSIRILDKLGIELINRYLATLPKLSFYEFLGAFFDLIGNLIKEELVVIYPVPNGYQFFKNFILLIHPIKLSSLYKFLTGFLPEINSSIILENKSIQYLIKVSSKKNAALNSEYSLEFLDSNSIKMREKEQGMEIFLNSMMTTTGTKSCYWFDFKDIYGFLSTLFEMNVPFEKEQIELILQKLIFGFRKFNDLWYLSPIPKASWNLTRFIIRLFLFLNFNLRKLSYWSLPYFIVDTLEAYFGLNSKTLVILTDIESHPRINPRDLNFLESCFQSAFLIEIENKRLSKIIPIKKEKIFSNGNLNDLESIYSQFLAVNTLLTSVINVDLSFLKEFFNEYIFSIYKFNLISKLRFLRGIKKKNNFNMFPVFPIFTLIKKKNSYSLFKMFLKIAIDKHEF